ncbi:G2/mitotic-specific cyclin-2-like [Rutidosis leptorrhynchoides]|uniref:G2/mitotic-specific cyclin-2-like n=1 Tax=Rutidosis leptorrhynchoides TaxID=125765 RepID=UPI003A99155C
MAGTKENDSDLIRSTKTQGGVGGLKAVNVKSGVPVSNNRRALSEINKNIIRATPADPYAFDNKGKKPIPVKKSLVPAHRPVTRTFSAQITSKPSLPLPEGKKPKIQPIPDENDTEDFDIVDVEDDFNAPMFVQHTEAMLEEIDKMDEDVYEELALDIDEADKNDPLAVVEYIDEIYCHYRKQEMLSCVSPMYMVQQQNDITERMRSILVDWLIEVHYKFELMEETLYLTVNLIDRYLERTTIPRKKLQLVGVTSMLLACKYEEVSVPVVDDFITITDKAYTRAEVLDTEKEIVNTLQFNLSVPTQYVFVKRFLKAAEYNKELELLSFYLIDLCLVEYEMVKFPPSLLAAAAVFTGGCTLNRSKQWTKTSELHSNYSEHHLLECSKMMVCLHQKSGSGKHVSVFKKYSTSKYGHAARTEPANFMLEEEDLWA